MNEWEHLYRAYPRKHQALSAGWLSYTGIYTCNATDICRGGSQLFTTYWLWFWFMETLLVPPGIKRPSQFPNEWIMTTSNGDYPLLFSTDAVGSFTCGGMALHLHGTSGILRPDSEQPKMFDHLCPLKFTWVKWWCRFNSRSNSSPLVMNGILWAETS